MKLNAIREKLFWGHLCSDEELTHFIQQTQIAIDILREWDAMKFSLTIEEMRKYMDSAQQMMDNRKEAKVKCVAKGNQVVIVKN